MVSLDDAITAKLESHGETFEILLDPKVFDLIKQGKTFDIVDYMAVEDVFKNASKGTKPAEDKVKEAFGTDDIGEIARKIVPTPQSPTMMPPVPSLRRNLRPFLSTSAQATTVITQFMILIATSDTFANAPCMPVFWKIVTV